MSVEAPASLHPAPQTHTHTRVCQPSHASKGNDERTKGCAAAQEAMLSHPVPVLEHQGGEVEEDAPDIKVGVLDKEAMPCACLEHPLCVPVEIR